MSIDDTLAATFERIALKMRATVAIRGSNGQYDFAHPDKTDLKCALNPLNLGVSAIQTGGGRAELASRGLLEWDRGYTMPPNAQIMVDAYGAQKWNVQTTTVWPDFGPGGGVIAYRADVVRAS